MSISAPPFTPHFATLAAAYEVVLCDVWGVVHNSIVAFADDAWVMKQVEAHRPADRLVNDLLRLRGHGVTNLALALGTARAQLDRTNAKRRVAILLSDCRHTTGDDPTGAARSLDELAILAPDGDSEDAELLAANSGARVATIASPFDAPAALARVLDR